MATTETWESNMSEILSDLNYNKLLKSPLAKIERYDLDKHQYALLKAIRFLDFRMYSGNCAGFDETALAFILKRQYAGTEKLLKRRMLLRCERALRRGRRLTERSWRARKTWQELPRNTRAKLLEKRRKELGRPSIVATHRHRAYQNRSRVH